MRDPVGARVEQHEPADERARREVSRPRLEERENPPARRSGVTIERGGAPCPDGVVPSSMSSSQTEEAVVELNFRCCSTCLEVPPQARVERAARSISRPARTSRWTRARGTLHARRLVALRVRIVGRGRVGRGLALALRRAGVQVRLVRGRAAGRATREATTVLAVPDPTLAAVAASMEVEPGAVLLHCSGRLAPEVIAREGAHVGAMHPLASFADPKRPPALRGTTFVIEGDPAAVAVALRLAKACGARALVAPLHGPAYHAAAALAANGAAALAAIAVRLLRELGAGEREANEAVGALLRTVGENVARVGVPGALSGPVIRGDDATVRAHREALEALDPDARRAYDAVAPAILECAIDAGLDRERAEAVRRALRKRVR